MKSLSQIYDISKMKEEDRRLIITYCSNSTMFNASSKLNNTIIFLALLSLLVATFSMIYSFQNEFNSVVITTLIIELLLLATIIFLYFNANFGINNITSNLTKDHNHFFEYHFNYAKRK